MIAFEEKFKNGDYIISKPCGDMAIYDKTDKKGYMHFKHYYGAMFGEFKDAKTYTLQINYQKFYEPCTDEEKKFLDDKLKEKGLLTVSDSLIKYNNFLKKN